MHKPLKILFFSDTHLGFDYPIKPRVQKRRRGFDFFKNFRDILQKAIDEEYDLVIHGGDLFFRSKIPPLIVDLVYLELFNFAKSGIPIYIVPGNHERSNLPDSMLISIPGINIFYRPMTYSLEIRGLKINLSGFPFVRGDIRRGFKDVLNQTGYDQLKGDLNLLITHHPFEGAAVGPVNFTFKGREDTIKLSDIPVDFHAVLAGHIHRRQVLNSNSTPVIFCGSTERTSFAEMEETKGYVKLTFCEKLVYEFIDLPTRPMHRITIPESVTQKDVIPYIQNKIADLDEDSIIRLECKSDIYIPESVLRMIIPDTMNIEQGYKKKAD